MAKKRLTLKREHTDYTFDRITPIIYKTLSLDRVFTNLLPLIKHGGYSVTSDTNIKKIDTLTEFIVGDRINFEGFSEHAPLVQRWLESDFVDLVNRGKAKQKYAAPIPLNINTYKLRNKSETLDYGVSKQAYALLCYGAPKALTALKEYLAEGSIPQNDNYDGSDVDIEWLVIMRLVDKASIEEPTNDSLPNILEPLCYGHARVMGDDILRLLTYKDRMPRRSMIDGLKSIIALHVTLYLFRLTRIIPYMTSNKMAHPTCEGCTLGSVPNSLFEKCAFQVNLVVDMGDKHKTDIAKMARQSYSDQIMQHDTHIKSQILLRKLYELADKLDTLDDGKRKNLPLIELLRLPEKEDATKVKDFFKYRIQTLLEATIDDEVPDQVGFKQTKYDQDLIAIQKLKMSEIDQYIEMLYAKRQNHNQSFYERLLESLLQRNTEYCLVKSGLGSLNKKRFAIGSQLLETLVNIALLDEDYRTRPLRLDELTTWFENRYGFYTVRPPKETLPKISELIAFRDNSEQFSVRMRDIGFYKTLSDAFISQTIQPRYTI